MPCVTLELPAPYKKQADFIYDPARYTLIESGTKTGKTLGLACWMVHNAFNNPATNWWWSAPVYGQVKIGFGRMLELIPPAWRDVNRSDLVITLPNGATIKGISGEKSDNLFGNEVHGGVIDEASRYREESFHAFRTTLTRTKGPLKIIGNPKGKRNWFWKLCQKAKGETGKASQYSYHHLCTGDNPFIDPQEIEDAKALLPKAVFEELYLGIAQDDITGVFRNILALATAKLINPVPGGRYVVGYDPARTLDNAALVVMEYLTRNVVYFEHLPQASWNIQLERVAYIAQAYNGAPVWADSTGLGDPLYEWLTTKGALVYPYKFDNESKQKLVENLVVDMEKCRVHYPPVPVLLSELELYEYRVLRSGKVQYSAPEGYHDDTVSALALANWGCTHGRAPDDFGVS